MVTQVDIARKLGISDATVSRILNNRKCHDADTQSKVLSLAAQLGYRHLRPSVRKKRSGKAGLTLLGVFVEVPDSDPGAVPVVSTRILRGAGEVARLEEIGLHVEYIPASQINRIPDPGSQPALLKKGHLSGLLLISHINPAALQAIQFKTPCILVNNRHPNMPVDCIGQNDMDAVELLVEHLTASGHGQIGFLSEPLAAWPYEARLAGYYLARVRRGISRNTVPVVISPTHFQYGSPAWEKPYSQVLSQIRKGVTAWICSHDDVAYGLMQFLGKRGLNAPADFSVCGFDNLAPRDTTLPGVTTIEWPFEDIGAAATRRLLNRLSDPVAAPLYTMFNGRLIRGGTTV